MIEAALAVSLVLVVAAHLWTGDRRDQRERDERQLLLQRIQAPQAAVVDYSVRDLPADPSGFPMSDAEVAEQQERERVIAFIEQHENGAG